MSVHVHLDPIAVAAAAAPDHLVNRRHERYDGDDLGVSIEAFSEPARDALRAQYAAVGTLLGRLRAALGVPAGDGTAPGGLSSGTVDAGAAATDAARLEAARAIVVATQASAEWRGMVARVREGLGPAPGADARVAAALHDVRGGAFQALALTLQLAARGMGEPTDGLRAFYLARDHLKIVRNAVPDLDPAAYARDGGRRLHGVDLLLEKWARSLHHVEGGAARVVATTAWRGAVSERCLEFSALDRIVYNLVNNAVRFATGDVRLAIVPLGDDAAPRDLRFVVANGVAPEHAERLRARFDDDLAPLFGGGFTTGGTGVGLGVCAEFVAHAYGLEDGERATRGRYVGARLAGDAFVAWFHWPTVG